MLKRDQFLDILIRFVTAKSRVDLDDFPPEFSPSEIITVHQPLQLSGMRRVFGHTSITGLTTDFPFSSAYSLSAFFARSWKKAASESLRASYRSNPDRTG